MLVQQKKIATDITSSARTTSNVSSIPLIAAACIIIPLVYLDIPAYLPTLNPLWLPKYWYYGFAIISLPALLVALHGRGGFLAYPFTQWSIAMVSLMSVHLLLAIFDGETERTNIIQTDMQYVILGALLGIAFSAAPQRYYKFLFPILSIAINAMIILDFLNPGGFYAYDQSTAVVGRGAGTFINPNRAGEALVITLLLSISFFKGRNLLFVLLVCGIGALLTFSRATIIAWLLLWPFALYLRKLPSYAYGVLTSLFFIVPSLIAIVTSYILSSSEFMGASANIAERLDFFEKFSLGDQSAQERSAVLSAGIEAFLEHPLFGVGSGATDVWIEGSTHNQPVRLAAEYGVSGLVLWGWLVRILWKGNWLGKKEYQIGFALFFIFFSMFSHNLLNSVYPIFTFALTSQKKKSVKRPA
jgi:O-antigen ligase